MTERVHYVFVEIIESLLSRSILLLIDLPGFAIISLNDERRLWTWIEKNFVSSMSNF